MNLLSLILAVVIIAFLGTSYYFLIIFSYAAWFPNKASSRFLPPMDSTFGTLIRTSILFKWVVPFQLILMSFVIIYSLMKFVLI